MRENVSTTEITRSNPTGVLVGAGSNRTDGIVLGEEAEEDGVHLPKQSFLDADDSGRKHQHPLRSAGASVCEVFLPNERRCSSRVMNRSRVSGGDRVDQSHPPHATLPSDDRLETRTLCVVAALAVLFVWPTWAPFDRGVFLFTKVLLWKCWYLLPCGLCLRLLFVHRSGRRTLRGVTSRRGAQCLITCVLLVGVVCIYVAGIVPHWPYLHNEWLLSMCLRYCRHPFRDCVVDYQTQMPIRHNHSDAVEALIDAVYGRPDNDISVDVERDRFGRLLLQCQPNGGSVVVPGSSRHVMIGTTEWSGLRAIGVDATIHVPDACIDSRRRHISNAARVYNAFATALRREGVENVSVSGCSIGGKIAYLAALTADHPFDHALIDSGGALVSSIRRVGPCGETLAALHDRWPSWVEPPGPRFPAYDIGDMMMACRTTNFVFTTSDLDLWNNPMGLWDTVARARAFGCRVETIRGHMQHCLL